MKDDTAAKDAARKTRREQWLRYLTFVAEEKICVSCSANRYKKWLSESPGYLICYIFFGGGVMAFPTMIYFLSFYFCFLCGLLANP